MLLCLQRRATHNSINSVAVGVLYGDASATDMCGSVASRVVGSVAVDTVSLDLCVLACLHICAHDSFGSHLSCGTAEQTKKNTTTSSQHPVGYPSHHTKAHHSAKRPNSSALRRPSARNAALSRGTSHNALSIHVCCIRIHNLYKKKMERRTDNNNAPKITRLEDVAEEYMEDHSDSEDAPLVSSLEIAASYKDHLDEQQQQESCLGDTWRLLAGLLLAIVMASPFFFYKQDTILCGMDYSKLYKDVSKATNWCKNNKKDDSCDCQNPVKPQQYLPNENDTYKQKWDSTLQQHASEAAAAADNSPLIVFLGDSITEHWRGTSIGVERPKLAGIQKVFHDLFDPFNAMAFGIAGDRVSRKVVLRLLLHV